GFRIQRYKAGECEPVDGPWSGRKPENRYSLHYRSGGLRHAQGDRARSRRPMTLDFPLPSAAAAIRPWSAQNLSAWEELSAEAETLDRKSTRLNSSHVSI